jgi:hypothetical protein
MGLGKTKYNPQICGDCGKECYSWAALENHRLTHRPEDKLNHKLKHSDSDSPTWNKKAGYAAIHYYVSKKKQGKGTCERCKLKTKTELANITGIYTREVDDYMWLCRRCHIIFDDRMKNLKQFKGDGIEK